MFASVTGSRISSACTRLPIPHVVRLVPTSAILGCTNAGHGLYFGKRKFATFTETTPEKTRNKFHKVHTLRPERLSMVDQQSIDLSGKIDITIHPLNNGPLQKCRYEQNKPQCFPENTKGFFYYYNDPDTPELCAGVRFRICDSWAHFDHGRDLLDSTGDVWGHKLPELVKHATWRGFLSLLRDENVIDEALINDINKLDMSNDVGRYHYSLSEPFILDVANPKDKLMFATRAKVVEMDLPHTPFADMSKGSVEYPLTGSIRVQFQLSHYIEHKKLGPTLLLRVINIVKPISRNPLYKGNTIQIPMPDCLLYRMNRGKKYITRIPLRHQRMADDLLELLKISGLESSLKSSRP